MGANFVRNANLAQRLSELLFSVISRVGVIPILFVHSQKRYLGWYFCAVYREVYVVIIMAHCISQGAPNCNGMQSKCNLIP